MTTSVRHPNRGRDNVAAALRALTRWYPTAPAASIDAVRRAKPGYPLIHGGSPCVPARNAGVPA